ncbi:MAG TPA: SagB/ThcOx family dehydrogenase [Anaerolineaceae bacterium]|nr:SagB/ThcOx family dehydrogenase [Anaerolineaceae bacterium]
MKNNTGHEFMLKTRYINISPSPQDGGVVPQPPLELPLPEGAVLQPLPRPGELVVPAMDLRTAIETRRTIRAYAETPLSLEESSYLLWISQGVKRVTNRPSTSRTVPSAGARHAFETYLLVNRVNGLESGLYRYTAIEHGLFKLEAPADIAERIAHACLEQSQVTNSAAAFIWVAVVERMFWRYVERGYRYLHLDAGHVCQNLALGAEQVGCGICPIAAFDDEMLNSTLGLDGEEMFVVYLATVGKKIIRE